MPSKDDVIVIAPGLEQRTSKASGKVRYTINVKAEPVVINLDLKTMGAEVTKAVIHHLRERVKGITAMASPATIKARKIEAKAYATGKPWAVRQFSGGKTGATPPNQSDRAFNNSGRFANSIVGNASSDGSWRINVAGNRLGDATTGGAARVWQRLVQLVPEFGDPRRLLESDIIRKSVERATKNMVTKMAETRSANVATLVRSVLGLVRDVGDVIAG